MAGMFPPFDFEALMTRGPTVCGSPAEVVDRIAHYRDLLQADSKMWEHFGASQPTGKRKRG